MVAKGRYRLLPLPCGPRKHRQVECLRATVAAIVVAHSTPPQSATCAVGSAPTDLHPVASSPTRFASLSYSSLFRHSSKVGAVCVEAPVRICAGGDQRWSSLPRPLGLIFFTCPMPASAVASGGHSGSILRIPRRTSFAASAPRRTVQTRL